MQFFFQLFLKLTDFIISDDCIKETYQNLSDYIQFLFKKDLNLLKKEIISSEKMRNLGHYNYNYAHLFFGKDF